jgi:hypothetical protein
MWIRSPLTVTLIMSVKRWCGARGWGVGGGGEHHAHDMDFHRMDGVTCQFY